jgi:hypothetical protein
VLERAGKPIKTPNWDPVKLLNVKDTRSNFIKIWAVVFIAVLVSASCSSTSDDSALVDALADVAAIEEERDGAIAALEEAIETLEEATEALEAAATTTEAAATTTEAAECAGDTLPEGVDLEGRHGSEGDIDGDGVTDQFWSPLVEDEWGEFTIYLVVLIGGSDERYHILEFGHGLVRMGGARIAGDMDGNGAQELWLSSPDVRHSVPAGLALFNDCALVLATDSEAGYAWILRDSDYVGRIDHFYRASCQMVAGTTVYSQITVALIDSSWILDISPVRLEGPELVPATDLFGVPDLSGTTFSSINEAFDYAADLGFEETSSTFTTCLE